jgi:hypothetical protein
MRVKLMGEQICQQPTKAGYSSLALRIRLCGKVRAGASGLRGF